MAYTTLTNQKVYSKVSGAADDTLLTDLINEVSAEIDNICNQQLSEAVVTVSVNGYCDTNGVVYAVLPTPQVNSLTNIVLFVPAAMSAPVSIYNANNVVITNKKSGARLEIYNTVASAYRCYNPLGLNVSYDGGYTTTPPEIELVCKQVVHYYYKKRLSSDQRDTSSFGMEQTGAAVVGTDWPSYAAKALRPYIKRMS